MNKERFASFVATLHAKHQASARLIANCANGVTVFLIDENHSSPDVIRDNINIAATLIQDFGVALIAVEGIEGDRLSWRDLKSPDPDRCFGVSYFGEHLVRNANIEVVGVDSHRLFKAIETDCEKGGLPPSEHPAQAQRSAHMLDALVRKLTARPTVSAAILNGGTRHNDDIERILRAKQPGETSAVASSFIRIRSKLYPTT
jgi:hypothetical protein